LDDPHTTGPPENVRDEAAEMVDQGEGSKDPMSPENIREHEPTSVQRNETRILLRKDKQERILRKPARSSKRRE
jgi:hypothetical protein